MSNSKDAFFKVLIVGDGAVGKTSICTHITTKEFFWFRKYGFFEIGFYEFE